MECVLQLLGYCTAQPTQKTLFQGAGKECPNNCQASDSEGAMQIQTPWPWNSGPAICRFAEDFMGVCLSSIPVLCGYWGNMDNRGHYYELFGP